LSKAKSADEPIMLLIRKRAHARAGLVGNPSDGYGGKTISLIVRNFAATVVLYEWEDLEIVGSYDDRSRFDSIGGLVDDVRLHGYYGGIRLVKATIKKFAEFCRRQEIPLHDRNFSVRYETNVPRQVGLGGSSAIIVATLRCLMEFYGVDVPLEVQPSLALSVETEELGIAAGLQDRAIQVYEGLLFMDFSPAVMHERGGFTCGSYEPLDQELLPPVYLAYSEQVGEPTEVFHNDIRGRFIRGEPAVVDAMRAFAGLTDDARAALLDRNADELTTLIDRNFDLRQSICRLPPAQVEMVTTARGCGASAKFAGSGGAIVGTYRDDATFERLRDELGRIGCRVIQPQIAADPD
jgi:glucuronokinase